MARFSTQPGIPKADYRCLIGDKRRNRFLDACDLGVTGVFEPQIMTITWKQGEIVDANRANIRCQDIKDAINSTDDLECHSVELIRLYEVKP